jgi:3-isopropylmalate/(R)-2-methylmalate dehydratase small subunit
MEKFTVLRGIAAPLLLTSISTDLIAPELVPGKKAAEIPLMSLRDKLFANLKLDSSGAPKPDFVLAQPRYESACILLAGANFGCGSSRETAVWALLERGIRCVIAPSFSDIFYDNAFQNGLLPIRIGMEVVSKIAGALAKSEASEMSVDLTRCILDVEGLPHFPFSIADDRRHALLNGIDQLSFILQSDAEIVGFERSDQLARPWIYPPSL